MYDRQTGSLWSHVTGECVEGELQGVRLSMVPAELTTYRDWVARFPSTLVLAKHPDEGKDSRYREYASSGRQGIFGTQTIRRELAPKAIVQGVVIDAEAAAVPRAACRPGRPVRFVLGGRPLVAVRVGNAVKIFERRRDDVSTQQGKEVPSTTAYWFAWLNFYPYTHVVK